MIVARSDPAGLIDRKSVVRKNDKESSKRRRRKKNNNNNKKTKDRIGGWRLEAIELRSENDMIQEENWIY
jgi:hypothetical protein